jgi:hypothetical protein
MSTDTTHARAAPPRRVVERDPAAEHLSVAEGGRTSPGASGVSAARLAEVRRLHADAEVVLGVETPPVRVLDKNPLSRNTLERSGGGA